MSDWGDTFHEGSLPEERLRKRAIEIGEAMTKRAMGAMTGAFDDPKEVRNAYNFFGNDRITLPILLDPAQRGLAEKLRELPSEQTVLAVQDTTDIDLTRQSTMRGLGTLCNPKNRGLFLHPVLAVSTAGVPLGVLEAHTWTRPPEEQGKAEGRKDRPFEEKESVRWWRMIEQTEELVDRPGLLVHIGDAEADIYELLARGSARQHRFLIRATQNRTVEDEHGSLWAQVDSFAPCDTQRTIEVQARPGTKDRPKRTARTATLTLRYGRVTLCPPRGCAHAPLEVYAILVREVDPPEGEEPIDWLLLTSDPLLTAEDAWLRVDWYRHRWVIEEYFKVLKTGLTAEDRQYDSLERYESWLGMALLTAVRLLGMTKQARIEPEVPASVMLSPEEEQVLLEHAELHRRRPAGPLRLRDAIVLIAKLGGYLGRSCDGPPGWITLWRGYVRLDAMVVGYRVALAQRSAPPP